MKIEKIRITGYNDRQINNQFINHHADHLVIMLPGIGYTNDMPLQYYTAKYFGSKEMDILQVNYSYNDNEQFLSASFEGKSEWIRADVVASIESVINRKEYTNIVLVCKSIGTIAGIEALSSIEKLQQAQMIWLTPLCQNDVIVKALQQIDNRSLIVIGTEDPCYVEANVQKISEKPNFEVIVLPETDHALEVKGDCSRSISIMKDIIDRIDQFSKAFVKGE